MAQVCHSVYCAAKTASTKWTSLQNNTKPQEKKADKTAVFENQKYCEPVSSAAP